MSNLIRSVIVTFTALTSLVLAGCAGFPTLPANKGGGATYTTNRVDLGGSESSSRTTGPGYSSQTSQWDNTLRYHLGTGKDRVSCLYDQGHSSSTYKDSRGKTVHQSSTHRRDCRPDPEQVIFTSTVQQPAKTPTPTPKDATCGDFKIGDSQGRLVRSCNRREDRADGRMSCLQGWDEVWVNGVLTVTGIDTAAWNCSPKAASAPNAAPAAAVEQKRPGYGRK